MFCGHGFPVKADQDPSAPSFFRIKFQDNNACGDAYSRLNGFTQPGMQEPLDLRFGRTFRTEGTHDDLVQARLSVISGPENLAWTVIKDALQAYTPILSVDQLSNNTYKLRLYSRTDYDYISDNLAKRRVQTPLGQEIVFELRPWVSLKNSAPTTAQKKLESDWIAAEGASQVHVINSQLAARNALDAADATTVVGGKDGESKQ